METMKMKINPLPARTWQWTRMNDSKLQIGTSMEAPEFCLGGQKEGLLWKPDSAPDSAPASDPAAGPETGGPDPVSWGQMETGMGEDFAGWMRESRTAFLGIPKEHRQSEAAVLMVDAAEGQAAGQLLIHAGAGAQASLIVTIRGDGRNCCAADTMALQLLIQAEADAHLNLYVVQLLPAKMQSCLNIGGVLQDRADVELVQLSLGAEKAYVGIAMKLAGEESTFSGDLGYHVRPEERVDINYAARQEGRATVSHLHAWGVLEEAATKLFRGTIDFKEGCAGSVGDEQEDVLLLGEKQENRTIPLILCHEEDVEGNHGATISRLDEQMLFYLGSRGVDRETAENMIARARLEALISRIPDPEVRRLAGGRIGKEEGEDHDI